MFDWQGTQTFFSRWNAKSQIRSLVCTLRNSNIAITSLVCTLRHSKCTFQLKFKIRTLPSCENSLRLFHTRADSKLQWRIVIAIFELCSVHTSTVKTNLCFSISERGSFFFFTCWLHFIWDRISIRKCAVYRQKWLQDDVASPPKSQFRGQDIHRQFRCMIWEMCHSETRPDDHLNCTIQITHRDANLRIGLHGPNYRHSNDHSIKLRTLLSCENSLRTEQRSFSKGSTQSRRTVDWDASNYSLKVWPAIQGGPKITERHTSGNKDIRWLVSVDGVSSPEKNDTKISHFG